VSTHITHPITISLPRLFVFLIDFFTKVAAYPLHHSEISIKEVGERGPETYNMSTALCILRKINQLHVVHEKRKRMTEMKMNSYGL
jgi:hypothetical protein